MQEATKALLNVEQYLRYIVYNFKIITTFPSNDMKSITFSNEKNNNNRDKNEKLTATRLQKSLAKKKFTLKKNTEYEWC